MDSVHRWRGTALLLIATSCAQLPPTSSVPIPPVPAGGARLWFYRDGGPRETQERPYLRLNGLIAGISEPNGVFYRDVSPGHYAVTVDSYFGTYVNQFADIDLAAGQEAYVKVLSQGQWLGGDVGGADVENFYTQVIPAEAARADAARRPFYGGN
ncbi:MAG: hypothetical protein JO282_06895 [Alphaproteobacteria bacterium]|nr:hypothetical protein [Alphaproteobacteria bacterium]